jgi:DNA-binding transcriptional MerR regulator
MTEPAVDLAADGDPVPEWTIDELAGLVGLPVRTLREYQSSGILHAPRRQGRVGWYGTSHLRRLQLIARLRDRGYSLAGIGDLLGNWSAGADLGEVLGLEPDQLVHIDEPGAPATLDQLHALVPTMIPDHLAALEATGVLEQMQPNRYCVPSPSLLQLTIDAINQAADTVADQVVHQIGALPSDRDPQLTAAFLQRGRGLLAHGVGRLTLHRIGQRLGVDTEAELDPTIRDIIENRGDPA